MSCQDFTKHVIVYFEHHLGVNIIFVVINVIKNIDDNDSEYELQPYQLHNEGTCV